MIKEGKRVEENCKPEGQNLQKSLMGPSGWQEKATSQRQMIKKLARVSEKKLAHAQLKHTWCHFLLTSGTNKTFLLPYQGTRTTSTFRTR